MLGLSLAFILSQDQTLRCCYLFLVFFLSIIRPRKSSPPKLRYLSRLSDAQIYRFYTCAKNHCDVDSVTFSCVTAAPVRTPHLPCLSLFLVYRNHFNELNSLLQTPGLACPVFPVCGCKGTTKNQYQPNISATFFQEFFAKIPKTSHISLLPPPKFLCSTTYFPLLSPDLHYVERKFSTKESSLHK